VFKGLTKKKQTGYWQYLEPLSHRSSDLQRASSASRPVTLSDGVSAALCSVANSYKFLANRGLKIQALLKRFKLFCGIPYEFMEKKKI
jgi:hypothetical protein